MSLVYRAARRASIRPKIISTLELGRLNPAAMGRCAPDADLRRHKILWCSLCPRRRASGRRPPSGRVQPAERM